MKRGLKVTSRFLVWQGALGCTNYPDEKGTESPLLLAPIAPGLSCTNYPDEKGTERPAHVGADGGNFPSCTNYPDEKGTES